MPDEWMDVAHCRGLLDNPRHFGSDYMYLLYLMLQCAAPRIISPALAVMLMDRPSHAKPQVAKYIRACGSGGVMQMASAAAKAQGISGPPLVFFCPANPLRWLH